MMNKIICILAAVVSLAFGAERSVPESYRISYPKYIPENSSFEVSLITSNYYPDADTLEVYVIPDSKVSLGKIELRSFYAKRRLKYSPVNLSGFNSQVYKAEIVLSDSSFTPGIFFQLLFNLKSGSSPQSELRIMGVYKSGGNIIGRINPNAGEETDDGFIKAKLNFYKPQKNAGNAVQFSKNSRFSISGLQSDKNDLLVGFWLKENSGAENILTISSKLDQSLSYSLASNQFQMLSVNKQGKLIENFNPLFLSNKNWYHIYVNIPFNEDNIYFYCNGMLIGKTGLPAFSKPVDLIFSFGDKSGSNNFLIDLLRFVDLGNTVEAVFPNKNYLDFIADSSYVISQFSFDNGNPPEKSGNLFKTDNINLQYVRSNAPIFARAPELNISIYSGSYSLKWSGGDFRQADHYVLQKSSGNSQFQDIYQISADNDNESEYSFIDIKDQNADVVYYRIKQVNTDGSVVYSSQVKVGQGTQEPFIIQPNYPNPFNPKTSIVVNFLVGTQADITVYNLEGKQITNLYKGFIPQGIHTFTFDGTDLPSGVYLYKITTPAYSEIKKMVLTK